MLLNTLYNFVLMSVNQVHGFGCAAFLLILTDGSGQVSINLR